MQWDSSEHAGFTDGTPWIKLNPNYKEINVKNALEDRNSLFYYYQKLIRLRKEYDVIIDGKYELLYPNDEQVYAYTRTLGDETLLVIANFTKETPRFVVPKEISYTECELLINNYEVESGDISEIDLKPYEARAYLLRK